MLLRKESGTAGDDASAKEEANEFAEYMEKKSAREALQTLIQDDKKDAEEEDNDSNENTQAQPAQSSSAEQHLSGQEKAVALVMINYGWRYFREFSGRGRGVKEDALKQALVAQDSAVTEFFIKHFTEEIIGRNNDMVYAILLILHCILLCILFFVVSTLMYIFFLFLSFPSSLSLSFSPVTATPSLGRVGSVCSSGWVH